jgi:hypothetical protein
MTNGYLIQNISKSGQPYGYPFPIENHGSLQAAISFARRYKGIYCVTHHGEVVWSQIGSYEKR